jgi:hypothetical protein
LLDSWQSFSLSFSQFRLSFPFFVDLCSGFLLAASAFRPDEMVFLVAGAVAGTARRAG